MTQNERQRTFHAQRDQLPAIVQYVREYVLQNGGKLEHARRLELAVDEAVTNIIDYAYGHTAGEIRMEIVGLENEVCVTIRDNGPPFDPTQQVQPVVIDPLETHRHLGLGIPILHHFADKLTYERTSDGWNALSIFRRIR